MVEWQTTKGLTDYVGAVSLMEARVDAILQGQADELVWLLEHPPIYTAGTSARTSDLIDPDRFPVIKTGRGGQYTYHGPGQRVVYVMLDLNRRGRDLRAYVRQLENWIIAALDQFGVQGETRSGRVGIWVSRPDPLTGKSSDSKIAAIGVRLRKWVAFHGCSINVDPELAHFDGIVPCGIADHGVTSLRDLGLTTTTCEVDAALRNSFGTVFE